MPLELQKNTLQPGHKLFWYAVERVLGQGGFGITYLAQDTNLDKSVAIKEFLPSEIAVRSADFTVQPKSESHKDQYQSLLERFLSEAKTLARFDHHNIVRVYSVFEANHSAYIVMRYEQGNPLNQILKQKRTVSEERLLNIVLPILDGLSYVHKQGFIHRDIQPANVYIRKDNSPVLLDFGSARQAIGESHTLTILIAPGYAPFEQYYSSGSEQGPWSDIYGMGATLYRAVAGVAPVDAIERSKGMLGSTRDVLVPAKIVGKGRYSDNFLNAIDHALEFSEKDRPQTVMEWAAEIRGESTSINEQETPKKKTISDEKRLNYSEAITKIPSTVDKMHGWSRFLSRPMVLRPGFALLLIFAIGIAIAIPPIMENTNLLFSKDDANESEIANSKSTNEDMVAIMESQMGQASAVEEKLSELKAQMDNEVTRITTLQDDIDSLHSKREEEQQLINELQEKRQQVENELSQVKNELQQAEQKKVKVEQEKKKIAEQKKVKVEQEKKKIAEQKKVKVEQERIKTELDNQKKQESVVEVPAKKKPNPLDEGVMAYKRSQYSDALRILTPLANEGNPIAQHIIATLYREGRGVLSNNALALKWMRKAASQGNTEAQVDLARMYSNGIDGKQDPFLAYTWYLVAERNGSYYVTGEMKKVEALLQTEQFSQALALAKDIGK